MSTVLLGARAGDPPPAGALCQPAEAFAWWRFDTDDRQLAALDLALIVREDHDGFHMEVRHRGQLLRTPEPVPAVAIDRTKLPVDGKYAKWLAGLAKDDVLGVVGAFRGTRARGEIAFAQMAAIPLTVSRGQWTDINGKRFTATQWQLDAPASGWQPGHWTALSDRLTDGQARWQLAPEYRMAGARSVKHRLPKLDKNDSLGQALVELFGSCIVQWLDNLNAVAAGDVEGIHQARVALRRLRSLLKLLRKTLPEACLRSWLGALKVHAGTLGAVRDWDVFCADGLAPATAWIPHAGSLHGLIAEAERARGRAFARLQRHLRGQDFSRLLVWLPLWVCTQPWREPTADPFGTSIQGVARSAVDRLERRVGKMADDFDALSEDERHRLRIRIKELRYACEFFSGLPGVPAGGRRRRLTDLQDHLGALNDAAVARRLMDELELASDLPARRAAEGWFAGRSAAQVEQFPDLWRQYRSQGKR